MSEYANLFEQMVDGMQVENINYPEIINLLDASVQTVIINNNIVEYLMNDMFIAIDNNNNNNNNIIIYCEDLVNLYNIDQLEIALSILTMVRELDSENIGVNVNNTLIENYLIELRQIYSNEELDSALNVLQFALDPSIFNDVNVLLNNNGSIDNTQDNVISILYETLNEQCNTNAHIKNIEISIKEFSLDIHDCPVCYCNHEINNIIETSCNHSYCKNCIVTHIKSFKNKLTLPACPMCRKQIDRLFANNTALIEDVSRSLSNI
jgi:hypothetical protein